MEEKHDVIFDCDQCGDQFLGTEDETPKSCPKCGKFVNFIIEIDDFRVKK